MRDMAPPTTQSGESRGPRWRFLRGWGRAELARALEQAAELPRNFDPRPGAMARQGFRHVCSRARITFEPPGPPGKAFERCWEAVLGFEHSDPRIVVAHFRPQDPLRGRIVLLELKVLGLRYLCPVRIAAVRSHSDGQRTLRATAIDTLQGHLERGREWFFLRKDHATGEVRFRLQAAWRTGDFPNAWSHVGFLLLGPRYQRAWHRLAHVRLRRIASGLERHEESGGPMVEGGSFMPAEPIRFYAGRRPPRGLDLEREEEEELRSTTLIEPVVLGAYSGIRSMAGPALAVRGLAQKGGRYRRLSRALAALAANELIVDKLPGIPPRTHPFSLAARAISGAFVASVGGRARGHRPLRGLLGAAAAVASAYGFTKLRSTAILRSKPLGYAFALAEDALAFLVQGRILS